MIEVSVHPAIQPVAFLLGRWRGEGAGQYPTIKPFRYREEAAFGHNGKPFLTYSQSTWSAEDGRPLHGEMGYLRMVGEGQAELVIAQGIGITEVDTGRVRERELVLESCSVGRTPTAKPVTQVRRRIWLEGETLRYELEMAFAEVPLVNHLEASLRRVAF